jgi:uncharacterized protein
MLPTQGRGDARWYWALPLAWLGLGGVLGQVAPIGLLLGSLFLLWLAACPRIPAGLWSSVTLLAGLALAAHLLPGFTPLPLSEPLAYSPDARPVLLRLSWDKVLAGLGLLGWWLQQPRHAPARWPAALLVSLLTLLLVPLAALALGVVGWQPKWPEQLALWLALNLGGAVLAEELLFRGLLQRWLVQRLGAVAGIGLTALLFGAAHWPFSPLFATVAMLAGLGYGLVFHLSGRLWPAMALHLAVNLCHLLLLTYPLRGL